MSASEEDRAYGRDQERSDASAAAIRAGAMVGEVHEAAVRGAVVAWRRSFDQIPKGWVANGGYPPVAWDGVRSQSQTVMNLIGAAVLDLKDAAGRRSQHQIHSVGGTRITCTCGRQFNTGPDYEAHLASV